MKVLGLTAAALAMAITAVYAEDASDYLGVSCSVDTASCDQTKSNFKEWLPAAYKGDYQSQRNVAYCLSTGCDGAILRKPIKGCAWRIAIVGSGSAEVDQSDTMNLEVECGKLTAVEREAAAGQATRILATIAP